MMMMNNVSSTASIETPEKQEAGAGQLSQAANIIISNISQQVRRQTFIIYIDKIKWIIFYKIASLMSLPYGLMIML